MGYKIISIVFDIDAQKHREGQFTVPIEVCEKLGLKPKDDIHLIIETPSGMFLYNGVQKLRSGTEIYGDKIRSCVSVGQRIRVTASRPQGTDNF